MMTWCSNGSRCWRLVVGAAVGGLVLFGSDLTRPSSSLAAQLPPAPELVDLWRPPASPPLGGVVEPVDIDVAADGSVFVVDRRLARVQRFSPAGTPLAEYRCNASGVDCLDAPLGVAVDDARSRIIVADTGHGRLVIFALDGTWLDAWSGYRQPEALAIGLDGRVYAYDRGFNGIKAKKPDGRDDVLFPVTVSTATYSDLPRGLATTATGTLLFASEAPVRDAPPVIYEFTPEGEIVPHRQQVQWNPRDIAVDSAGMVFILDGQGGRLVRNFNLDRPGGGPFGAGPIGGRARAIAAAGPDELVLVMAATGAEPPALRWVTFDGRHVDEVALRETPPLALGWFNEPLRVSAGPTGDVALVDGMGRAQTFHNGEATAQLRRLGLYDAVLVDDGGFVVLRLRTPDPLDSFDDDDRAPDGKRVLMVERYEVHRDGTATRKWELRRTEAATGVPQSNFAALDVDTKRGWVYVLESTRQQVLVLNLASGAPIGAWILPDLDGLIGYTDLAVARDGTVGLLNAGMNTLVRYKPEAGRGNVPADPPSLSMPRGSLRYDLASDGDLVVTSSSALLFRLTPGGDPRYMWNFDAPGASGEPPTDVAAAKTGGGFDTLYLVDRGASMVAVYRVGEPVPARPKVWLPFVLR